MAINLNQFEITKQVGDYAGLPPAGGAEQMAIDTSVSTAVPFGAVVTLAGMVGQMTSVKPAGGSDKVYGVVVFNPNKQAYLKQEIAGIATVGDVVYLQTTAAAVAVGAMVGVDATTGFVKTITTGSPVGVALTSAPSTGGAIKVKLVCPTADLA